MVGLAAPKWDEVSGAAGWRRTTYLVSKHTQPYVKAQLDDGTWRYLETYHKVRVEHGDNHLEEELHKSQGLEGCCSHREGLWTVISSSLFWGGHLVVVDETAYEWPGKAMRANLYRSFTEAQGGNHLYDELAFLKRADANRLLKAVFCFLQDYYFWGGIENNSFQFWLLHHEILRELKELSWSLQSGDERRALINTIL